MTIEKIRTKIQEGKKLTKKEEKELEEYDNTHTDNEFNVIIGLNRDMSQSEKAKIIDAITATHNNLGYDDLDISD
jgi:hypothetical protein